MYRMEQIVAGFRRDSGDSRAVPGFVAIPVRTRIVPNGDDLLALVAKRCTASLDRAM